ncbi:MAG: hypothetical protein V4513_07470 [Pseudomonadota bacterium]
MAEEMLSYIAFSGHDAGMTGAGSDVAAAACGSSLKVTDLQHDQVTFVNLSAWAWA